jgi:RimJ/RimL family protein N-acetyltransferase
MTRMALPTPTLHTARLRLRPFDDADANDLFALHSNAYVLRYWDAATVERTSARRAFHHGLPADGTGRHRGAAGRGSYLRRDVHRLVQPEPVESGLPQRIARLLL